MSVCRCIDSARINRILNIECERGEEMKIFCMIIGLFMVFRGFEDIRGTMAHLFLIIYYLIACFLVAFPLYLEFFK